MLLSSDAMDQLAQTEEVFRRFPLLKTISLFPLDSDNHDQCFPQFLGILLGVLESEANGAVCIALPRKHRIAFTTAVLTALSELKREFPLLAEKLLIRNFRKGQLVRVAPEGYVYEFDEYFPYESGRFFRLKIPNSADSTTHGFPVEQAFRLSSTDQIGRRAPRNWRPGPAPETALDHLLGIETRGNTAALPNHVLLLSSRSSVAKLATSTLVKVRNSPEGSLLPAPVYEVLSWGRLDDEGKLISEENGGAGPEPLIATTHSIERLAAACSASAPGSKMVIIDGIERVRNLQALDDIRDSQRTLILATHADAEELAILKEHGVLVWAPDPRIVGVGTLSSRTGAPHPLLEGFSLAARNAAALDLQVDSVSSPQLEEVAARLETIEGALRDRDLDERVERLIGQSYGLLTRAAEWIVAPPDRIRDAFREHVARTSRALEALSFWFTEETRDEMRHCFQEFVAIADLHSPGREKTDALMRILAQDDFTRKAERVALVVRTPEYAAYLRDSLDDLVPVLSAFPGTMPEDGNFDWVILGTWLSRERISKVLYRYSAPSIRLILYPFERDWYRAFETGRARRLAAFDLDSGTLAQTTGFDIWTEPPGEPPREQPGDSVVMIGNDPITRLMEYRGGIRKGQRGSVMVPEGDVREARYIDFHGSSYAYLTDSHKVPVVTGLILGEDVEEVPLRTVRNLGADDYVLFREHGGQDIIALIAEAQMGRERYSALCRMARSWREVLGSIAPSINEIYRKLRDGGTGRTETTVRNWLRDEGKIGPRQDRDLHIIAEVSGNPEFQRNLPQVEAAISAIRGAHIQAGFTLSRLLLNELPEKLDAIQQEGSLIDLTFGSGWIVCVRGVSVEREERAYWEVNRLLWDHEF